MFKWSGGRGGQLKSVAPSGPLSNWNERSEMDEFEERVLTLLEELVARSGIAAARYERGKVETYKAGANRKPWGGFHQGDSSNGVRSELEGENPELSIAVAKAQARQALSPETQRAARMGSKVNKRRKRRGK